MAGLLSGLEQFGLGGLEGMELYDQPKKKEEGEEEAPVMQEQDYLFDKSQTCPICDKEFKVRTIKVGKVKMVGADSDLRPRYEQVDRLKYDVIMCPRCGYTTLSRFFESITSPQAKRIKETISAQFKPISEVKDIYTYDEALERYKLALANAIVKLAKSSEKAYICLKTAWLLRGKAENLDVEDDDYEEKKQQIEAEENEFLKNALDGFLAARQTESFPMCGMDEVTLTYLAADLARQLGRHDEALRMVGRVLMIKNVSDRIKQKAIDLKEQIRKEKLDVNKSV